MHMCAAFAALGHDVQLFCRPGTEAVDPFRYYGLPRSFGFAPVRDDGPRGLRTARHVWRVRGAVRARRPDALFGRDLYALAANVNWGLPTVLEVHRTMEGHRAELAVFDWLFRQRSFRRLVVVSGGMRDDYLRRFPDLAPERIMVEPGAAEPIAPDGDVVDIGGEGRLKVGYVGHLYAGRGIEVIIATARLLPDVEFHIVGGSDADLERWRANATEKNVAFHGHVPPSRIPAYLRAFDVLIAPYQRRVYVDGGAETSSVMSPLKIFEYMSTGRPIVCSDLPVLREVLTDETALLVPPEDPQQWAAALRSLASPERRRTLGGAARQRFLDRHTWRSRAQRIALDLARECAGAHQR